MPVITSSAKFFETKNKNKKYLRTTMVQTVYRDFLISLLSQLKIKFMAV